MDPQTVSQTSLLFATESVRLVRVVIVFRCMSLPGRAELDTVSLRVQNLRCAGGQKVTAFVQTTAQNSADTTSCYRIGSDSPHRLLRAIGYVRLAVLSCP